jgi:hypothetical protein
MSQNDDRHGGLYGGQPQETISFMSPEHVAKLNDILASSLPTRLAASKLPREILWAHRLTDEDTGEVIWWQTSFHPKEGVRLALQPPSRPPDVQFGGGYWAMLDITRARLNGIEVVAEDLVLEIGSANFLDDVAEVYNTMWTEAAMDIVFPDRRHKSGKN